jgi:hypothetical protein
MGDEANLKECAKTIFDRYKIFDPIHYHKESSGDCWLNLDWSAKFPGGTFFSATRELAVSLDGTYKVYKAK